MFRSKKKEKSLDFNAFLKQEKEKAFRAGWNAAAKAIEKNAGETLANELRKLEKKG